MAVVAGTIGLNVIIAGVGQLLTICYKIYEKYQAVTRYNEDCTQLLAFVKRVQVVLESTQEAADMKDQRWQAAFKNLHTALQEVDSIFTACAKVGKLKSLINADSMNSRLSSASQRLQLALSMIPIQQGNITAEKLDELKRLQSDLLKAQWHATQAAKEQADVLKRLADQTAVDASETQQLLKEILSIIKAAPASCKERSASPEPSAPAAPQGPLAGVQHEQLEAEKQELLQYKDSLHSQRQYKDEARLQVIIRTMQLIESLEAAERASPAPPAARGPTSTSSSGGGGGGAGATPPDNLKCPITLELFRDPVLLVGSGHTYERQDIEEWLSRGNNTDPSTGVVLTSTALVPNIAIRKQAQDWLESNHKDQRGRGQDQQQQQQQQQAVTRVPSISWLWQLLGIGSGQQAGAAPADTAAASDQCGTAGSTGGGGGRQQQQQQQQGLGGQPVAAPLSAASELVVLDFGPESSAELGPGPVGASQGGVGSGSRKAGLPPVPCGQERPLGVGPTRQEQHGSWMQPWEPAESAFMHAARLPAGTAGAQAAMSPAVPGWLPPGDCVLLHKYSASD